MSPVLAGRLFNTSATWVARVSDYWRNANQNYNEVSPHTSPNGHLQTVNAGEGVEKREPFYVVGGNVNWYSCYVEQYEYSLRN